MLIVRPMSAMNSSEVKCRPRRVLIGYSQVDVGDHHWIINGDGHGYHMVRTALGISGAKHRCIAGTARIVKLPVAIGGPFACGLFRRNPYSNHLANSG